MIHAAVNLLWCAHGRVGGSEEYLVRQLDGLADVAPEISCDLHLGKPLAEAHPSLRRHRLRTTGLDVDRRAIRIPVEHTAFAIGTRGADLVHHGGGTAPLWGRGPRVVTVHDLQYLRLPQYFTRARLTYLRAMMGQSVRRATVVTTPTAHVATTVTEAFGIDPDRIVVVPHGVPAPRTSADEIAATRERYLGADDRGGRLVLLPAITHPHKGHLRLISAFARWSTPVDRLVLIGGVGAAEHDVMNAIRTSDVAERIDRPGRVDDDQRDSLIAAADVLVLPSEEEGFGAPVIEAMAAGTPVIVSDIPALVEVGGGAAVVATDGIDTLVEALETAVADRDRLIAAGLERSRHFTTATSGAALAAAYRKAVGMEEETP